MGREFRGLKSAEVIKAFIRAGGIRRSGKGSHVNIKMPNGTIITIPASGEIKVGLLINALRKAGLTTEAFLRFI